MPFLLIRTNHKMRNFLLFYNKKERFCFPSFTPILYLRHFKLKSLGSKYNSDKNLKIISPSILYRDIFLNLLTGFLQNFLKNFNINKKQAKIQLVHKFISHFFTSFKISTISASPSNRISSAWSFGHF